MTAKSQDVQQKDAGQNGIIREVYDIIVTVQLVIMANL